MRIFFIIIVYNVLLLSFLLYTYFFSSTDVKISYLKDVTGFTEEQALEVLIDYEITLEYVESTKAKETVLYSSPSAGELVYEKQMVTLYVSKGYLRDRYLNIENTLYEENVEYLNELVRDYKIELVITYKKDNLMLDGLIYQQFSDDDFIDIGETVELVVISNPKTIKIPDFIGWSYIELLKYCQQNELNIIIEYIPILYLRNHVVGQSVSAGEEVLKNSNPIVIYLSKEI